MIFLKKFIANGFKSFASKIDVEFKNTMSGIVGPNGSGKSNIIDAIKWVMGEKSNKMLRGKVSEDVIFHGSKEHAASKFAEITLEFDNSNHALHIDSKDVIITRRLTRGTGVNEYFLNGEQCRLKDIQDIFLDTGLSKGSLGIISQGTVQWFVDAKPEERRTIFEDASGIGLYTKKRDDANKQLQHTQENLNRISDITNELHNSLIKLQKQADKAKIYVEKQKELKQLDITIMVKDLKYFTERLKVISKDVEDAKDKLQVFEPNTKELIQSLEFAKEKAAQADKNIEMLTNEFNEIIEKINKLEIRKSSIQSKMETDLSSDNLQKKIEAYKNLISSTTFTIEDAKANIQKLKESVDTYNEIVGSLTIRRNELNNQANEQSGKLIETRTKIKQLVEYLSSKNGMDLGPRTIIENKAALTGIHGLVKDFLMVDDEYQQAIATALGRATQNVVVDKNVDAQNGVEFLKQNRAGKATFLPLESIKPKSLRPEHLEVISNKEGFIGIANELIKFDKKYSPVFSYLLGNVIISEDMNSAFLLSKLTYQMYRVITLDGDIVAPGGSVTGGYNSKVATQNEMNPQKTLDILNKEYPKLNEQYLQTKKELEKCLADLNENSAKLSERKILLSRYEETSRVAENQLLKYQSDYEQLLKNNDMQVSSSDWNENTIEKELSKLSARKNKINEDLSVNRQSRSLFRSQIEDQEAKLNELRFQVDAARDMVAKHEGERVKCETVIENAKNKINQTYQMTIEFAMENYKDELPMSDQQARDAIMRLQAEITRLGPINMEALKELDANQERYDEMYKQQQELESAKSDIEAAIAELDKKAKEDFGRTIDKVNEMLPDVFKYLFGGGTCRVEYTDPENILTSGIDVTVAPFGKNVTRLSLLSGGEKSLVALSILFAILRIKSFPLIILDEAESALDPANVERFANIIRKASDKTQFIVITHRPGTMEKCDVLYGATMQTKGVTSVYHVELSEAQNNYSSDKPEQGAN